MGCGMPHLAPDGRYIATTSFEDMARVWDAETGYLVAELKGHNSTVWGRVV